MSSVARALRPARESLRQGALAALKEFLRGLDRRRWFHAAAMRLVRAMNRAAFRRLEREPAIAAVWVKGSFVRGPFRPLASDVDLVIVLRDAALGEPVDGLNRVFAALRAARRRNPSVRDWWQHLLLESELPQVRRFWSLYGADEWRDESGAPPLAGEGTADLPALVLAQWYQQCLWSGSAAQKFLDPSSTVHDLRAGLRKAAFFASRLTLLATLGGARLSPGDLFALRRGHALEFDAAWRPPGRRRDERLAAIVAMVRELAASARRLGAGTASSETGFRIASDGLLWLGLRDDLSDAELGAAIEALRADGAAGRSVTWLVPASAWRLWPRPCIDRRFDGDDEPADIPFRQRLHLFETLFLPASLRLALSWPDADERLRRSFWAIGRAWLLYARGRWAGTRGEVARALLADGVGDDTIDAALRRLLAERERPGPALPTRELLALEESLVRELWRALPPAAPGATA